MKVLITRTAAAANRLITELVGGAQTTGFDIEPVCLPVRVATFEPACLGLDLWSELASGSFDWLTFTSANGVRGFVQALAEQGKPQEDIAELLADQTKVAGVGKATQKVLAEYGIATDLLPAVQDASGLLAEFEQVKSGSAPGQRVLCIQGTKARPTLAQGLAQQGWQVTSLAVYQMTPFPAKYPLVGVCRESAHYADYSLSEATPLLADIDLIIATAPSLLTELTNFWRESQGDSTLPPVLAIGATTLACAQELGLTAWQSPSPQPADLAQSALDILQTIHEKQAQEREA